MKNKKIAALAGAALMTIGLATLSGCSTESEIKEDFDWAWEFAEEVDE